MTTPGEGKMNKSRREDIVRITTHDTGKTYEFVKYGKPNESAPRLFKCDMKISPLNENGQEWGNDSICNATIYLELDTLINAGIRQKQMAKGTSHPEPTETVEDLLIRLLESVGYYPAER